MILENFFAISLQAKILKMMMFSYSVTVVMTLYCSVESLLSNTPNRYFPGP